MQRMSKLQVLAKSLLLLPLFLTSCMIAHSDDRTGDSAIAFGGKGAFKSKRFATTWDNEKSFGDAAMLAGIGVAAVQAVKQTQATELTSRVINTNSTNQAINASNNAAHTAETLGAQNADVIKATTLPK